jgi:Fe-S oxidoreductase/nitrate reductase gamma subunit
LIPTRVTTMYAAYYGIMYTMMVIAIAIFCWGLYSRFKQFRLGQREERLKTPGPSIIRFLKNTVGHVRILRESYPGIMHWMIFWGFLIFALGTASIAMHEDLNLPTFQGGYYLILSFILNLFSLLAIAAIVMALWRRLVTKPDGIDSRADDYIVLGLIFLIVVTGLFLGGLLIVITQDPWAAWRPVEYLISTWFGGLNPASLSTAHAALWWLHVTLAMGFIAYIPYSKLFHIFAGPINQYLAKDKAAQSMQPIDLEDESTEQFGVAEIQQFTWKQLLDGEACIRCGRCQDNCPAYISGKPLSPKKLTQDLKNHFQAVAPRLAAAQKAAKESKEEAIPMPLVPDVISEEEIWACTTCRSCEEQCPVFVEHVPKVVDIRRNLVMMESSFPAEAQTAFRGMENNGNPWNLGWKSRSDWTKDLDVPELSANQDAEYLYWPGCAGAFDNRNKKVAVALVQLFKKAGVSFAILGNEEKCCGDSARRLGNEYLYQTLARENIETMNGYGVKKIITPCPHCFNTLKHEYPQFGGNYEVIHHSVFLNRLIREGKLKPQKTVAATCTYHDSCYLGRYNDIYTEPREVLSTISGIRLKEMKRNYGKGFCCGAGGGRMWLDEPMSERVNFRRTEQALETGADSILTACPYCLTMLEDGIKAKDLTEKINTKDIAEVLWESIQ